MKFILSPIGTVTSEFGAIDSIRNNVPHSGVDFACPSGLPVHSLTDGIISKITNESSTLGNGVFIKTEQGYQFIYGHFSRLTEGKIGALIHKGDVIGWCGSSGRATGSHVHFAIKDKLGHYVDPQEALHHVKAFINTVLDVVLEVI